MSTIATLQHNVSTLAWLRKGQKENPFGFITKRVLRSAYSHELHISPSKSIFETASLLSEADCISWRVAVLSTSSSKLAVTPVQNFINILYHDILHLPLLQNQTFVF